MKNWSNLEKDDILYLYVPMADDNGKIIYNKQESKVINSKNQDIITYIRFKYSDIRGKRHRLNLAINQLKYDLKVLAAVTATEYARDYDIKYGDFLVSYISYEELENQLSICKQKRIEYLQSKVNNINKEIETLKLL